MKKLIIFFIFSIHHNSFSQTWTAVASGTDDDIFCQGVYNGNLFIGGSFYNAGGMPFRIAMWNGSVWDSVPGAYPSDNLSAMEEYNGEFYVGFGSNLFNGLNANGIVKWDGSI